MDKPKLYGPYPHKSGYRCKLVINGQSTNLPTVSTAEKAELVGREWLRKLIGEHKITVGEAQEKYRDFLRAKGNKPDSISTTLYRLRRFFVDSSLPIASLTSRRCAGYYSALTETQKADTHRNTLAEARTFCRWLYSEQIIGLDPLASVKGIGRRSKGKPQLHIDEARSWLHHADEQASAGQAGAVAAMVSLLMALRAGEIVARNVRDLDCGGSVLWIPQSKTAAGKRRVKVPPGLQPHLLRLALGKSPTDYLFSVRASGKPPGREWVRRWVKKLCRLARVPEVCAHSMRGLHATLAVEEGTSPDIVARSLGHNKASVTLSSYAAPGSRATAVQRSALQALEQPAQPKPLELPN
jgi:integrase